MHLEAYAMRPSLIVGIDPGVTTGVAVWDRTARVLTTVGSMTICAAMEFVKSLHKGVGVEVWFEDAKQRKWLGDADERQRRSGAGIREGVGSVKRDCSIWREFCDLHKIPYKAVKPASGATKWTAEQFALRTKWQGRTNNHGRDAACIVWGAA